MYRWLLKPRLHQGNMLPGNMLPATCVLLPSTGCLYIYIIICHVLLPVTCISATKLFQFFCPSVAGYNTSRPWHKWIVMLPRYRQHVARTSNFLPGNMLPSTCWRQHVAHSGSMFPWYKRGFINIQKFHHKLLCYTHTLTWHRAMITSWILIFQHICSYHSNFDIIFWLQKYFHCHLG